MSKLKTQKESIDSLNKKSRKSKKKIKKLMFGDFTPKGKKRK